MTNEPEPIAHDSAEPTAHDSAEPIAHDSAEPTAPDAAEISLDEGAETKYHDDVAPIAHGGAAPIPGAGAEVTAHEDGEPRTITIGLGPGLVGIAAVGLIGGWLLVRSVAGGSDGSLSAPVAPAPAPASGAAAAAMPAAPLTMGQASDGELVPGMVLDVADPTHLLANTSAPDIAGALLDGTPAKLSDHGSAPVLLNFWATWCPPCRLEMPWLEEAWQARREQGLVVLAVNAGERVPPELALETVRRYVTAARLTFPVLIPDSPDAAQLRYQALSLPTTFLIRGGQVQKVVTGAFPNRATLNAQLDALMAGEAR